jgi:glutamate decarboxylase
MHYSLEKAADLLGIGTAGLVRVPVDTRGRVDARKVAEAVANAESNGELVLSLVGIGGTTDSGAIDPLAELADLAAKAKTHLHVDAAWGGPVLFSRTYARLLDGIARADSVTIDGHKQLYLPVGIGMVFFRDPDAAGAIEKQAAYIIRAGSPDLGKRALEGSRPGMALFLHAALHVLGKEGYEYLIDEGIRKAQLLATLVREDPAFELLLEPQINIVDYRVIPTRLRGARAQRHLTPEEAASIDELNVHIQEQQKRSGQTFVSRTQLAFTETSHGRPVTALRAVLANPLTEDLDVREVLAHQRELLAEHERVSPT